MIGPTEIAAAITTIIAFSAVAVTWIKYRSASRALTAVREHVASASDDEIVEDAAVSPEFHDEEHGGDSGLEHEK